MDDLQHARLLGRLADEGTPFAVATVVRIEGSSLGKPGFRMVISEAGEVLRGTLGGACPDGPIVQVAQETLESGDPRLVKVFLEDVATAVEATVRSQDRDEIHVETNCGGMMEVYVEPFRPRERLIVVGEGGRDPVEDRLVQMGKILGFEVVVVNHQPVLSEEPHRLLDTPNYDLRDFAFRGTDSVLVLTKGARDVDHLEALATAPVRYVGLLASRKRVEEDRAALRERGIGEGFLDRLHAPIGVDLGAVSPAELALSILAEVVATRHGRVLPRKGEAPVPTS